MRLRGIRQARVELPSRTAWGLGRGWGHMMGVEGVSWRCLFGLGYASYSSCLQLLFLLAVTLLACSCSSCLHACKVSQPLCCHEQEADGQQWIPRVRDVSLSIGQRGNSAQARAIV